MSEPSPWPANATVGPDGVSVAGVAAEELARRFGTPLFVMDEDDVRARCRVFATAFPRVLYAVKAFTSRTVIRIAREEGIGFLAATGGEVEACLRAGADPAQIALHGNNKLDGELRLAVRAGLGLVMADNAEELERLDRVAREAGRVQPVLLRVTPGISGETHAYLDTGGLDSKFGTPVEGGRALDAVKRAVTLDGLAFKGLHAHIGSQLADSAPFVAGVDALFALMAELRDALGVTCEVLDAGGGFAVTYTDERPEAIAQMASEILGDVRRRAGEVGLPVPELIVEPGRALVANPILTLYRVGAIKRTAAGETLAAVDGGMSDNIRPALYGARYTVAQANAVRSTERMRVTVVGRQCESGDVLARDVDLPADLRTGDLVAFAATGAYGYSMASNYNRMPRPAVVAVHDGRARVVLRREDAADMDRLEADVEAAEEPPAPPPEGIVIRPARPKDARSFHHMWKEIVEEGLVRSQRVRHPVRHYKMLFKDPWTPGGAWIVAVEGDEVVGLVSLARETHEATRHVATLGISVDPRHRGRGVGSALMAEALRWAREQGMERIVLSVYPENAPAIALYRKFGFVEEGRLVRQTKRPVGYEDEIMMARWLG